ncbi:MAG TPA: aromatic acid exporter family protein [Candidatus Sulfotelmatobacter sp.]|jgi:uncharacterized membrane protein YgaE (UPF0421/DUF939 family)
MISFRNFTFIAVAQAIKTGLAAVISIYAAELLKLPQGYWAAITAIVVMQSQVKATLAASRDRLIGTAIGACIGALFVAFVGDTLPWFGAAIVVTTLICQLTGLDQSYRLACVTVAIVMLVPNTHSPWMLAVYRFTEVALGIVIALAVNAIPVSRASPNLSTN